MLHLLSRYLVIVIVTAGGLRLSSPLWHLGVAAGGGAGRALIVVGHEGLLLLLLPEVRLLLSGSLLLEVLLLSTARKVGLAYGCREVLVLVGVRGCLVLV